MTEQEITDILGSELPSSQTKNDVLTGLNLLAKYTDGEVIVAAEHDEVYSIPIYEAAENGITLEEVIQLRGLGWSESEGSFHHFV